eukprot:scaffold735_cov159-Ochromonas_danica.AAC.6
MLWQPLVVADKRSSPINLISTQYGASQVTRWKPIPSHPLPAGEPPDERGRFRMRVREVVAYPSS